MYTIDHVHVHVHACVYMCMGKKRGLTVHITVSSCTCIHVRTYPTVSRQRYMYMYKPSDVNLHAHVPSAVHNSCIQSRAKVRVGRRPNELSASNASSASHCQIPVPKGRNKRVMYTYMYI